MNWDTRNVVRDIVELLEPESRMIKYSYDCNDESVKVFVNGKTLSFPCIDNNEPEIKAIYNDMRRAMFPEEYSEVAKNLNSPVEDVNTIQEKVNIELI